MNKKIRTIFFIAGLLIFVFLIREFGIGNILANIRKTGWWILPITGIWFFVYLLNGLAFSIVLKPYRDIISFREILSISISGFAINYLTPLVNLGGEPYRIMVLKEKLPTSSAVSSVILYSMLHFFSSFIFWIAAILIALYSLTLTLHIQMIFGLVLVIASAGVLFFMSRHKKGIFRGLIKLISRFPFSKKITEKIKPKEESLGKIDDEIINFYTKDRSGFYTSLFLEVAARFLASVEFIFIMQSVGMDLSYEQAVYINAFSSLVMNVVFFIPMGFGIREGSLYFIMNMLKFSSGIGIYIGLINRIRELFWIFIGLILIQFRKTKTSKEEITGYVELNEK